ncbi:Uncharacterised protein [Mycobacteroides abscessus subsp. massiliense]|nr:Uncharacterised protein [Mycobacteroides abscessus subsp. massiliense]
MIPSPIYPFRSSEAFANRMRQLRRQYGNLPMDVLAQAKGPSTSTQGRIENAEGDVTEETMAKYVTAYQNLRNDIADWASVKHQWAIHNRRVDPGFILALAEAGSAVVDEDGTAARSQRINEEVDRTGLNAVVFGADIRAPFSISGSVLRMLTPKSDRADLCGTRDEADTALFVQLATKIASRHRTVSITHQGVHGNTPATLWPSYSPGLVQKNAHGRIDPLDHVQTLGEARRLAAALCVPPTDIEAVAATIFLIVALTFQRNAIADTTAADGQALAPLETWRRYANTDRWDKLKASLPEPVAGAMPPTETMIATTRRTLEPWVTARTVPSFEVMFSVNERRDLTWHETPLTAETPLTPENFDLWVVPQNVFLPTKRLLAHQRVFGVAISDDEVGSIDPTPEQPVYDWCPSGIDDNISMLYEPQFGWRAVQIA